MQPNKQNNSYKKEKQLPKTGKQTFSTELKDVNDSRKSEILSGTSLKQEIMQQNKLKEKYISLMVFDPSIHSDGVFIDSNPDIPSGKKFYSHCELQKKIILQKRHIEFLNGCILPRTDGWLEIDAFISLEKNAPKKYLSYNSNLILKVCRNGSSKITVQQVKDTIEFNNLFIEVKSLGEVGDPDELYPAIYKGILQLFVLFLNWEWYYGEKIIIAGDKLKEYESEFDNSKNSLFLLHIYGTTTFKEKSKEYICKSCEQFIDSILDDATGIFGRFLQQYLYIKYEDVENLTGGKGQYGLKKHSSKENWKKILGDIFTDGFKTNTAEIMKVSLNQQMNSKIEEKVNSAFKENFKPLKDSLIDICLEYLFPKEDISS